MAWSLWRGCRARGRRFAGCVDGPVHWMGVGADVSLDASAGVLVRVVLHVFGSGACLYAVAFRRGRRLGPVNFSFSPSASSSAHGIRGRLAVARMRRFMSSIICWRSAAYAFGGSGASSRTGSPLGPSASGQQFTGPSDAPRALLGAGSGDSGKQGQSWDRLITFTASAHPGARCYAYIDSDNRAAWMSSLRRRGSGPDVAPRPSLPESNANGLASWLLRRGSG